MLDESERALIMDVLSNFYVLGGVDISIGD